MLFSTSTSNRLFQYIPVKEDFVIQLQQQYCALESEVGPFRFIISGKVNSWTPSSGEMDFQFTAVDILLFGNKVKPSGSLGISPAPGYTESSCRSSSNSCSSLMVMCAAFG